MPEVSILFLLASLTGVISGCLSSLFLYGLSWVTDVRFSRPFLILSLPLFGLLMGWVIKRIPHHINQGVPYILEELENDKAQVSVWMIPFIFIASLGTHLFGGSAGREGVGVIMGASAAHILPHFSDRFKNLRSYLIYCGMAAGFSSIFGTPLAAIFFAFELHGLRHLQKWPLLFTTILASLGGYLVSHYFGPAHFHYHIQVIWGWNILAYVILSGLVSGFVGQGFYWGMKGYTNFISRLFPHLMTKLFFGSLLIVLVVYLSRGYDYIGIGTHIIASSFERAMSYQDFLLKFLLTIMTLSLGFKGGEVTPLFFIGATCSNFVLFSLGHDYFALSAGLGMMALFGAVSGTPIASAIMGLELFGPEVGLLCFISCFIARKLMMNKTIYRH